MVVTASSERRIIAFGFDAFISVLFFMPVWIQSFGSLLQNSVASVDVLLILRSGLVIFLYRWFFLYFLGGTLGKLIMGLRVVNANDPEKELGLFQAFLRVLADGLSLFFGEALRAVALLRFDRTHVADWVAETRVVQSIPRQRFPRRRKILAVLIIVFSGFNALKSAYLFCEQASYEEGKIMLPLELDVRE